MTSCIAFGEPCRRPEVHRLDPELCPRCGALVERVPYDQLPCLAATGCSLPWTHEKWHNAPCGLSCEPSLKGCFWAGPGPMPIVHSDSETCPRCKEGK